jgi:hypothetical protein
MCCCGTGGGGTGWGTGWGGIASARYTSGGGTGMPGTGMPGEGMDGDGTAVLPEASCGTGLPPCTGAANSSGGQNGSTSRAGGVGLVPGT